MLQKSSSQNMHQARVGTRPSMHQGDARSGNNTSYNESRREATQTHTMWFGPAHLLLTFTCLALHSHTRYSHPGLILTSWFDTHILVWYWTVYTKHSRAGLVLHSLHDTHIRVGFCAHDFHQERMMTSTYTGIAHMTLACWFGDDIYVLFLHT